MVVGKHVVRTSDRISFKRCRRSWDMGSFQRQRYVPLVRPKPLDFGIAMHEAWAVYYDPDTWHIPRPLMLEPMLARFMAVTHEQLTNYREAGYELAIDLEQDFEERIELGRGMIEHYVKWAPKVDNFKPVKVEYDFEVPIMNPFANNTGSEQLTCACHGWPVFYQGRIDGIIQDDMGFYWILEHKTAAQLGPTDHLVLDEQCGSYAWALQHYGMNVRGVVYNEAIKNFPTPPTRLKSAREGRNYSVNRQQRTTYEVYMQTLIDNHEPVELYQEFLQYLKDEGNPFFRRTQVHRNHNELKDIGVRVAYEALDMINPDLLVYPNPTRINCQMCSYRTPCIMMNEGSDYEFYLKEFYVQQPIPAGAVDASYAEVGEDS